MSRLLFLTAVIVIIYWLLKSYRKHLPKEDTTSMQAEDMVLCVHCGVHLPKRESIQVGDKFYCSEEHRRIHAGKSE